MWVKIGHAIVSFLHWCTGWFVHPEKGGCCQHTAEDFVKENIDNMKK